jgi:hypothetical protein
VSPKTRLDKVSKSEKREKSHFSMGLKMLSFARFSSEMLYLSESGDALFHFKHKT